MTGFVYFIQRGEAGPIKIGHSGNPKTRLAALQTASDQLLRIIGLVPGDKQAERQLHLRFASARLEGEWFSPTEEISAYANRHAPARKHDSFDYEAALEDLRERFRDNPSGLFSYMKSQLPAETFNRLVELTAENLKTAAMRELLGDIA